MDINAIKAKLDDLTKSNETEKTDYSKVLWQPGVGKYVIRIVPSVYNPTFPFTELKTHYEVGKYPMLALSNFGKQDPVEEFCKELKSGEYNKDNWSLSGKLEPKVRIYAPVVVRGEEDKGVRLWSFGITVYKALLTLAEDEEVGDYTDVMNGTDLTVTISKPEGKRFNETTIMPKRSDSPLSKDAKQVELWLKEQPNPLEIFTEYKYEFIKEQLQKYLNPSKEEETDTTEPESKATDNFEKTVGTHKADFKLEDNTAKKDPVQSFDELFKD